MLDQLQPDAEALWAGDAPKGSVVACDFYNAGALLPLNDEAPDGGTASVSSSG